MNAIIFFALMTVINVTLSTIRSLCTIKGGKWLSAITNAVCYGFYPLIVMLTAKDTVTIWVNMIITAVANFVCVWLIKLIEEKARKDKLWLVKITIPKENAEKAKFWLKNWQLSYSYVDITKYIVFDVYCDTQEDTEWAIKVCKECNGKMFATENKLQTSLGGGLRLTSFFFAGPGTCARPGIQRFKALQYFSLQTGARQIAQKNPENFLFFVHFAYCNLGCNVL